MGVSVTREAFQGEDDAVRLLAEAGMHTTKLEVPPDDNALHWHHFDAVFYILSGHLELTDGATGQVLQCPPGSRVDLPARTLHAERSDGYTIVLGTSVPPEQFGEPVNRPAEALKQPQ
jgi:mannose-6-phosphate isomerase-like protein (cupin superfamily)